MIVVGGCWEGWWWAYGDLWWGLRGLVVVVGRVGGGCWKGWWWSLEGLVVVVGRVGGSCWKGWWWLDNV